MFSILRGGWDTGISTIKRMMCDISMPQFQRTGQGTGMGHRQINHQENYIKSRHTHHLDNGVGSSGFHHAENTLKPSPWARDKRGTKECLSSWERWEAQVPIGQKTHQGANKPVIQQGWEGESRHYSTTHSGAPWTVHIAGGYWSLIQQRILRNQWRWVIQTAA